MFAQDPKANLIYVTDRYVVNHLLSQWILQNELTVTERGRRKKANLKSARSLEKYLLRRQGQGYFSKCEAIQYKIIVFNDVCAKMIRNFEYTGIWW